MPWPRLHRPQIESGWMCTLSLLETPKRTSPLPRRGLRSRSHRSSRATAGHPWQGRLHRPDPTRIAQLKKIESELISCYGDLLGQLKSKTERGGSLLGNTSVLFGSNLGSANAHDPRNNPVLLAGGPYKHGRFIAHDKDNNTPLCNQAILSCLDSKTGDTILERTRLPGISNIYSSPVGAAGHVYLTGRNGTTLVLDRSEELNVLATNKLDDRFDASPALAGNRLILRGSSFLYCLSENQNQALSEKGASENR